jgi:phosphatidylcholine synthase
MDPLTPPVLAAWLVHLYTGSGFVLAYLAARAAIERDYREAFLWLAVQVVVDSTDGALARLARVKERLPWFDGRRLDDLIDYLTYVFVPALIVWRADLLPPGWTIPTVSAMLLASGYGFSRADAKTTDHFFTGFPSYWNVVSFYLLAAGWPAAVNGAVLLVFVALVFVPVRYVYPSRTPAFRAATIALGSAWGVLMLVMVWQYPGVSRAIFRASLAFPIYYFALSLWLHARSRRV